MKDFLGNELAVGDQVVYLTHTRTSSSLNKGVIKKITPKMVSIEGDSYRNPIHVVKVG